MSDNVKWIVPALLGALFAAVVQVTSKAVLNAKLIDAAALNLIRAVVMAATFAVVVAYGTAAAQRDGTGLTWAKTTDPAMLKSLAIALFSGGAAAASWYFGYRALQLSDVSKTYSLDKLSLVFGVLLAMVLFRERPNTWNWAGILMMLVGAYLVTIPKTSIGAK